MATPCKREKAITVKVTLMGELGRWAGKREVRVELFQGSTIEALAQKLRLLCDASFARHALTNEGSLQPHVAVFINGVQIGRLEGTRTVLTDGVVEMMLVPMYEGG